ncbi:UNVERIFIED_CONTAM: hypothetical protein GTU68_060020 [Idotea baltica]|nr:hypothetical protein [Idotea baltica]
MVVTTGFGQEARTDSEHHYFHKEPIPKPHVAAWSYSGDTGPVHWGNLCPDYALAKDGKRQSPINIEGTEPEPSPRIVFNYCPSKINLVYNGHTIEEAEEEGSSIAVAGRCFELKQFHFHAPSEHAINGKHAAMEMHLVHKDDAGRVAVIGVMINEGNHNPAFDALWQFLPTEGNKERQFEQTVDATDLLPKAREYFHYMGSFTTPPCTEGVFWYVLRSPIELSAKQIAKFTGIINNNNRPIQALNDRPLTESTRP